METPMPTNNAIETRQEGLRKCPACGAIVPPFTTSCPDCGADFYGSSTSVAIQQFADKLAELDERIANRNDRAGDKKLPFWRLLLRIIFFPYYIIIFAITIIKGSSFNPMEEQKKNYINTFPIPTSKEDILEFMTLCQSNITTLSYIDIFSEQRRKFNDWNALWIKKMEYILKKASIAMTSDKKAFSVVEEMYNQATKTYANNKKKLVQLTIALTLLFVIFMVLYIMAQQG